MKRAAVVALMLLAPVAGMAADTNREAFRASLRDAAWIGGAAATDLWSTELVLRGGGRETNPIMRGGMPARAGIKLAVVGFGVAWADHERKNGNARRARIIRWSFVAAQVAFAGWNLRQARAR